MDLEEKVLIYDTKNLSIANFNGSARFIIVSTSLSSHCCFDYSVVDTECGWETNGGVESWKMVICETFDKNSAITICYALNQHFQKNQID